MPYTNGLSLIVQVVEGVGSLEPLRYKLSEQFHKATFDAEQGVEPMLVVDRLPEGSPRRFFLARYVLAQGGGSEGSRPIFRNQLIGYDYEMKLTYPTQREHLERLQSLMESFMYAPTEGMLSRAMVQDPASGAERPIRIIVSEELVSKLVDLYEYAW